MGKYIMISLDDDKSKNFAEVLTNDTCKKILSLMAESDEVTESDLAKKLKIPLNTVNYNMRKLTASHLVEESDHHLWSEKGRKIRVYRLSEKSILISPKSKSKINKITTSLITIGSTFILGLAIRFYFRRELQPIEDSLYATSEAAVTSAQRALADGSVQNISKLLTLLHSVPSWGWFLVGGVFAMIIVLLLNWRKL
jgi:predicted ArsR family transcriptional regulator